MFTKESSRQIGYKLAEDWNTKSIYDFAEYFTEDVEIISTNVQRFISESNGHLNGKKALINYWEYVIDKFPYHQYKIDQIEFEDNTIILRFFNANDNAFSYGKLYFNEEMKIYKMETSYV
jgi:hypothetical protein